MQTNTCLGQHLRATCAKANWPELTFNLSFLLSPAKEEWVGIWFSQICHLQNLESCLFFFGGEEQQGTDEGEDRFPL